MSQSNRFKNVLFMSQLEDLWNLMPWVRARKEAAAMRALDAQKRRIMSEEEVHEDSRKIVDIISQMHSFLDAKTVLIYYPMHNEVDLRHLVHLFADQKTFLLPATKHRSHNMEVRPYQPNAPLHKGYFNIPVPNTPAYTGPIDCIIVPGVSFDRKMNRIGRGGGFYDHFLKQYRHSKKIGVCYDFQLHNDIPHTRHDVKMDRIVTPKGAIE